MTDLCDIGNRHQTDKAPWAHGYTVAYHAILSDRRELVTSVFEIGIERGASLRMWGEYFPQATIYGLDNGLAHFSAEYMLTLNSERTRVFIGDQVSGAALGEVVDAGAPFDLIVDDGGHVPDDYLFSAAHLWPHVRAGGFYCIEDVQDSEPAAAFLRQLPGCVSVARVPSLCWPEWRLLIAAKANIDG